MHGEEAVKTHRLTQKGRRLRSATAPLAATVGELGPNPVRHLARCGTAMLAARLYAREATNQGGQMRVLLACAIIITTAIGLAGCFHHQQAIYAEPTARPPLK